MDLYKQSYIFKGVLLVTGAIILVITLLYSNYLANNLKDNEEKNIYIFKEALKEMSSIQEFMIQAENDKDTDIQFDLNRDITLLDTIIRAFPLPIIFEDENGTLDGQNFTETKNSDRNFLQQKRKEFMESGQEPLTGTGYASKIYYFNSPLSTRIKYFPLVQALLVGSFIAFGYFLFNASKRAEQNQVWAGMAKETAHQLGTPISAILGWVEYLKEVFKDKPEQDFIIHELKKDVDRLELVADRFSKIGSKPVLKRYDLFQELVEVKDYIQRRSPKKVVFEITPPYQKIEVEINQHLFAWVIENLLRNSLDAMENKGKITIELGEDTENIFIDISDTGHGIPGQKFKSIFRPGYSTKKRGWGLGLSLAKRIIEEYHKGKIFVKSSKPFEKTTFSIKLNKIALA
ncbi:MAG: HAMP domain-containing histidine kinase [Saprospiraceae bacterium]|nr:HAMP domain-containing histidine kinase [Saprospiraceae bacterium]MBK6566365.1 HAMP domain-containing histidine kinase [Saprospiraceae bacterium]MBK7524288.1 HAMP domain-containing histidine kinase [Saprospiraceae bacterium]MBK8372791.1 HAMP domain-containing histidine kinase [Saprospiraceae bacterium]MBK8820867.1 HAMP domain-containing histidine kinase [Saprospiraceae bacterium]